MMDQIQSPLLYKASGSTYDAIIVNSPYREAAYRVAPNKAPPYMACVRAEAFTLRL